MVGVGDRIYLEKDSALIVKGEFRNDGKGRWQGRTVSKPYWRLVWISSLDGTFYPVQHFDNDFLAFNRKYKAEIAGNNFDKEAVIPGGFLLDSSDRWWIVHEQEVICRLIIEGRDLKSLKTHEWSPNIIYPDDNVYLVDSTGEVSFFNSSVDAYFAAVDQFFKKEEARCPIGPTEKGVG